MFGIMEIISAYVLVIALLTLLVAVLLWQRNRTQKTIKVWLASGAVGILLGGIAPLAMIHLAGYDVVRPHIVSQPVGDEAAENAAPAPKAGPGRGGPGRGGGMSSAYPSPRRDLTVLVRKLGLLTGDIALQLTGEQAASIGKSLEDVDEADLLSDPDAKTRHEAILAVLDDDQQSRFELVNLPRRRGGPAQGEPANPFKQGDEAEALQDLRNRLAPDEPSGGGPPVKE